MAVQNFQLHQEIKLMVYITNLGSSRMHSTEKVMKTRECYNLQRMETRDIEKWLGEREKNKCSEVIKVKTEFSPAELKKEPNLLMCRVHLASCGQIQQKEPNLIFTCVLFKI
jgi:hypothetical protein